MAVIKVDMYVAFGRACAFRSAELDMALYRSREQGLRIVISNVAIGCYLWSSLSQGPPLKTRDEYFSASTLRSAESSKIIQGGGGIGNARS